MIAAMNSGGLPIRAAELQHAPPNICAAVLNIISVITLFRNSKGLVELGKPNTCAKVNLCLFLFTSALKIVCHETEILIAETTG